MKAIKIDTPIVKSTRKIALKCDKMLKIP